MTTSSYASTAVPPKIEADMNFGGFEDDMFSHLNRKQSPEAPREPAGRSLLSEKRTFQAEPIKIHPQPLDIEPPLTSWESHGSADNLMSSARFDTDSPPPPPPPHKYSSYAPVASHSPPLQSSSAFEDSFAPGASYRKTSPEAQLDSVPSSSANSYETPYTSRSATASSANTSTTPKAAFQPTASPYTDADEDDLFTPVKTAPKPDVLTVRKSTAPASAQRATTAPTTAGGSRVMSQAEFREYQKRRMTQPPAEESSDDEDYEDEEEAIRKREEEELMRRKNQQMNIAREAMRRSTTAPGNPGAGSMADGMGFPSETSMRAEEWEDEDVPLGILAQHGFPSQTRSRFPSQPTNAMPSYIPDRPASAGAMSQRTSTMNLPAFARNLPQDPYGSSFIGGGLVRPTNRESMGFNGYANGPGSVAGDSIAGGMGMPAHMMYQEPAMSAPSLVDQIQMRDMSKKKYMGGASAKKPEGGPFTGMLGQQMNANGQAQNSTRMSQMPMMNGMNGANPMMNMMGGQMPMMGMGMNPMGYPMPQGNDYMQQMQQFQQMQQMIAMQQMQLQMMHQQPQQDPRMSMALPSNYAASTMGGSSFLNVPNGQNRPMSFMSPNGNQQPQQRAMSFMGPSPGYTPSIAPSERSNIGLSARYRPVVNHSDATSNGTSMTLQASGGANQNRPGTIKGILKKAGSPGPQINVEEEDEDWSRMAARKNKSKGKENQSSGLEDLTRGLNI
jgi:hypothetical protein